MSAAESRGRVVVGVDGSAGSLTALRFAFDEAARQGTGLLVVAAFELPDLWWASYGVPVSNTVDDVRSHVEQTVRSAVAETLKDQVDAPDAPTLEVVARAGNAAEVLLSASDGSPLLVVGNRGLGGFKRMLLGSVSLQCVQHATCPVTVVHSSEERRSTQTADLAGAPEAIL
jgi:nucleotide-binding universal stress UspA family protein